MVRTSTSSASPCARRTFLKAAGSLAGAVVGRSFFVAPGTAQESRSSANKVVVAVMGVNGRGGQLAATFLSQPNCEVGYVCDVDERALARVVKSVRDRQERAPQGIVDFRQALDDKGIDALVCAAPNHWHAPATILACAAGKHVYVEKPCSHNPREGQLQVAAARKYNRVVQMGVQRRSFPAIIEAIEKLRAGEIGRVLYSRTWYNNTRPSIGHGRVAPVPSWLNWTLWQGPAPERPYMTSDTPAGNFIVPYNWHWHWHWGNGELGNNGVHALDIARWGLNVDYPIRVTSGGGKYRYDDDQETPDTHLATFDFPGGKSILWEGLSWSPYSPNGSGFGITFHGTEGTLVIEGSGYRILDLKNKEVARGTGSGSDAQHVANFLDCVRRGGRPNADIEEGHKSTLLCHLGNIAYRVQRVLHTSEKDGKILHDDEAMQFWSREYRPGWEPKV